MQASPHLCHNKTPHTRVKISPGDQEPGFPTASSNSSFWSIFSPSRAPPIFWENGQRGQFRGGKSPQKDKLEPNAPSALSGCQGTESVASTQSGNERWLSQMTRINYIHTPRESLPPRPGLLALHPVCSEDWASAVAEVGAAVKHLPPEACGLVRMSSLQPHAKAPR